MRFLGVGQWEGRVEGSALDEYYIDSVILAQRQSVTLMATIPTLLINRHLRTPTQLFFQPHQHLSR